MTELEVWSTRVERILNYLPHIRKLLPNTKKDCIFGSFLQTVYQANKNLRENEIINLHFFKLKKDIDIRSFVDDNTIRDFFKCVVSEGGYVEYAGTPYCTKMSRTSDTLKDFKNIDLNMEQDVIVKGNYWVYLKYEEGFLKYDISYLIEKPMIRLDFVANALTYPFDEYEKTWNLAAFDDIRSKRITPITEVMTPKLFVRAKKLLSIGFNFENDGYIKTMFSEITKPNKYFPRECAFFDTNSPSMTPKNSIVIRSTKHKYIELTTEIIGKDETILEIVNNSNINKLVPSIDINLTCCVHYRKFKGVTTDHVIVYKPAMINSSNCIEHIDRRLHDNDLHNNDNFAVCVVKISVPIGTKYKSYNRKVILSYDFDEGKIEDVYSYPNISILKDVNIENLKQNPIRECFRFRCSAWGFHESAKTKLYVKANESK